MVVHLGRLKLVIRRKKGKCVYKHCPKGNIVLPGDKVFLLTKMGSIPTRTKMVIFYKAFHRDCFLKWADWVWENQTPERDGRPSMKLDSEVKTKRAKLVRERARLLRALRTATSKNLEPMVERIAEVDKLISATGYPVMRFKGRRSQSVVDFGKFVKEVKDRYLSEMRVPRSAWDQAASMGQSQEFREEMEKWRKESQENIQSQKEHYEDKQEDKEEE